MIGLWGWPQLHALMIFGDVRDLGWAIGASMAIIVGIMVVHVAATVGSLKRPRAVQRALRAVISAVRRGVLRPLSSTQAYPQRAVSVEHRVNGKPPCSPRYKVLAVHGFVDWRLRIGGLVERPMAFTLADLRALGEPQTQRVLHNCVQGWSSIPNGAEAHYSGCWTWSSRSPKQAFCAF